MLRFVKYIVLLLGVVFGCQSAFGFALFGQPPTNGFPDVWQTQQIGYNIGNSEGGTPKDIHEEYRRNTPVIYYAFDEPFLEYFNTNGIDALEKAFAMYNSIGKATQLDPNDYPEDSRRVNFRAQSAGLVDLKSAIMGLLMKDLGLFEPSRWVWALHDRAQLATPPGCPFNMGYTIYHYNFSITPVGTDTYPTTSYVNGVLYSYFIDETCGPALPFADAVEFPVDPLSSPYSAVADWSSFWYSGLPVGGFYTTLTRDDVAGLKYLLSTNNLNNEASGPRTTEFLTNNTPATIQTQDLGLFAAQALTNTAAGLTALYPGLIVTSTSNFFGVTIATNVTASLVTAPFDPAGTPPHIQILSTNYTTNFANFFVHTFANIVTNTYATRGVVGVITIGVTNDPFAVAGTLPTTNFVVMPLPVTGVFGDFFILPTNLCGAQILSNFLTQVIVTTNLPTVTVGPATNSITFTPGSITFNTNHTVVYLPVTCPIDSIAQRGGVDRIIFVRRDYDSLIGQAWEPVTNDYTVTEFNTTNSTYSLKHFQRRVPRPDFLFSAADLATDNGNISYSNTVDNLTEVFTFSWLPISFGTALEADSGFNFDFRGRDLALAGPGTIIDTLALPKVFILNKLSPLFLNESSPLGPFLIPSEFTQVPFVAWGSFDGTTNAPVVYPNGSSLGELENLILGPSATTRFLPNGNIGLQYWAQLAATGGTAPYTWALAPTSPGLPGGLNLSSSGKITGIPSGPASIYDFTVRLTDSAGVFRDVQFTITIF